MRRRGGGPAVDTSGPLHVRLLSDGWYIVGDGTVLKAHSRQEGERIIKAVEEGERAVLSKFGIRAGSVTFEEV